MNFNIFLNTLLVLALPAMTFAGAKPAGDASAKTSPGKEYVYKESDGKPRKMEIYFPPNHDPAKSKVPGMILFHGGGWSGGSLAMLRE